GTARPATSSSPSRGTTPAQRRWGPHGPAEHRGAPGAVRVGGEHAPPRTVRQPRSTTRHPPPARKRGHQPTARASTGTDQEHDMSILYKPVKIASAAHAEALPVL